MEVSDDWTDALAALITARARFLVVGAHALAVHGVPRATQDLDVWVDPSPENAICVWQGLAEFGAPLEDLGIRIEDFCTIGTVVQLGLPPRRIDVLTSTSGVDSFAAAWADRVERPVQGHTVAFIGREALIANKRAADLRHRRSPSRTGPFMISPVVRAAALATDRQAVGVTICRLARRCVATQV